MKNLVIVGLGNTQKIRSFVSDVEKEINKYYKEYNVNIYNEDTIERAQFNPELLQRRGRFSLNTNKSVYNKTYFGVFDCNYDVLYNKLFHQIDNPFRDEIPSYDDESYVKFFQQIDISSFNRTPPSNDEMLRRVYNAFYKNDEASQSDKVVSADDIDPDRLHKDDDFSLEYSFEYLNWIKSEAYFTLIWRNNEKNKPELFNDIEQLYLQKIKRYDHDYGDILASAYITNGDTNAPTEYTFLYNKYCNEMEKFGEYLLGVEWTVYIGKRIKGRESIEKDLKDFSVEILENGKLIKSDCKLSDYNDENRREMMLFIGDLLLPCAGNYQSCTLRRMRPVFCTPKAVAITKDVYLPQFDTMEVWISSKDDFDFDNLQILNDSCETFVFYGKFDTIIKMFEKEDPKENR